MSGVPAPRARLSDHLRVAWVLVVSAVGWVPYLIYVPPVGLVLGPWLRRRTRRLLERPPAALAPTGAPAEPLPEGARVFVLAGERSGDQLAARVVRRLRAERPDVVVRGYAGARSREAGMEVVEDLTEHAVVGVIAVVRSLAFWWRVCVDVQARLRAERPDVVLTVDFPGLNVRIGRWARGMGIRTVHLVAPQLWAHAPWRAARWRRAVDRLLALLPFEPHWFRRSGIPTLFVGHPLFEAPLDPPRTPDRRPPDAGAVVELWPGSRRREVAASAPVLAEAARVVAARLPDVRFVVRLAEAHHRPLFEAGYREGPPVAYGPPPDDARLLGALACSGTVTAELAVALVPAAVFYRVSGLARFGAFVGLTTPWISLANLVSGREVLPERLCVRARRGRRVGEDLLERVETDAAWAATRRALEAARERLSAADVAARIARVVLDQAEAESARAVGVSAASSPAGDPS